MYTVLDIETTGGKFNEEGITEIAIHRFDGEQILDSFISLINPEKAIQPYVVQLTGINQAMLKNAPKFYDVAKRILEITENSILVAHNAEFDYRMLRLEFKRLGYTFESQSICTVSLSKLLIPDLDSYKLGNLCKTLGIPLTDRHRANGDALATTKLFQLLLSKDLKKQIGQSISFLPLEKKLNQRLAKLYDSLPAETGIYFIHNYKDQIIYIEKSKNIRQSVNKLFLSEHEKSKKVQKYARRISFELTGSELIALLKEKEAIKTIKPIYSKLNPKKSFTHGLYAKPDKEGYIQLQLEAYSGHKNTLITFTNHENGLRYLSVLTQKHKLCDNLITYDSVQGACHAYKENNCLGACIQKEDVMDYNKRVNELIDQNSFKDKSLLIVDKGRNLREHSAVLIEDGKIAGLCFFDLNYQVNKLSVLHKLITPITHDLNLEHLLKKYMRKKKSVKILPIHE